ncbi:MAG: lactate utilization protein [Parabacteroides sp.]|nr:lactate utilization protein [Parabacteroides sp.]
MNVQAIRNERLAEVVIQQMKRRHINAYYCASSADAIKQVQELIPEGSSITWGGSLTIREMGLTAALKAGNYQVFDRDEIKTQAEKVEIYRKAFSCDYYLTSANAITEDGLIVNIDGSGNRVAAITWGPEHVIFVVGMNKVCHDLEAAMSRARHLAAPVNATRIGCKTPCQVDGICHSCHSTECICNYLHVMRNSYPAGRHTVILVGEEWGY